MVKTASDIFAYNLKNLKSTCKLRGENRKRVLKEMEFMRTHQFKKQPKKAKRMGIKNKFYGKWVKRSKPIKIINFKCKRKK